MMMRVFSWCIAALVVFGVVKAVESFKNPWAVPSVPAAGVLSILPPASDGCGKSCDD